MDSKPVIIGSSLTGLLISHSLANHQIDHILIGGDKPAIEPRLGESMNEGASLACWQMLGSRYRKHFFNKSHISLFSGSQATLSMTGNPNRCFDKLFPNLDGPGDAKLRTVLDGLMHLDRSSFDPVFYEDVTTNTHCEFVPIPKAEIDFDSDQDLVRQVTVGDRIIADPAFVFDATGVGGTVATAANIEMQMLSGKEPPKRLIFGLSGCRVRSSELLRIYKSPTMLNTPSARPERYSLGHSE